jgi:hypothetical protein
MLIYFLYEIDAHRSHDSKAIKGVYTNLEAAEFDYNRLKFHWRGDDSDYLLCLGSLDETTHAEGDDSLIDDIDEMYSTEDFGDIDRTPIRVLASRGASSGEAENLIDELEYLDIGVLFIGFDDEGCAILEIHPTKMYDGTREDFEAFVDSLGYLTEIFEDEE